MKHESGDLVELEKIEAFTAVLLSEQIGPLSPIQRDLLETIQTTVSRLLERTTTDSRFTSDGPQFAPSA